MLLNDIGYAIYYSGGARERPLLRRGSWPKASGAQSAQPGRHRLSRARRLVGRSLIGLGRLIAAEPRVATLPRIASSGR